jgi:hypothetical protein
LDFDVGKRSASSSMVGHLFVAGRISISMNPLSPWKVLKMSMVADRRKTDLAHYIVIAFRFRAGSITVHPETSSIHSMAKRTNKPSWKTKKRNRQIRSTWKICFRTGGQAEMAHPEPGLKPRFLNSDALNLFRLGSLEPKIQPACDNRPRAFQDMESTHPERSNKLVASKCGIQILVKYGVRCDI